MARRPRAPPMAGGDSDPRAQRQGVQGYDGIDELAKTTVVKPSDLDEKAVKYLDFVQANGGRGNEACTYLKSALEGMSRDHVSNWKAYVYTLLRGFDEEAYKQMKISEGKKVREPRRGAKGDKEKKDKFPVKEFAFNVDAAEFVPSSFKPPQAEEKKADAGGGAVGTGPVCGGFSGKDVEDPDIKAAAEFAVGALKKEFPDVSSLVKIAEASSQVVAGTNFMLKIHVAYSNEETNVFSVKVFRPLPHTGSPMQLSQHEHLGKL
ncbi:unnamed protein product [Prorocentrum cordatum]|uniref:Cystatin domain-containing protein n=1 Tax=Prorocentrum cordatum TaxID=2364126 RepID=A0ABN9WLL3_9DINO|nr:unnamed protein product [Polarella glacialis]